MTAIDWGLAFAFVVVWLAAVGVLVSTYPETPHQPRKRPMSIRFSPND